MNILNSIKTKIAEIKLKNVDPIDLENAYNSVMCIYFKGTKELNEIVSYNKVEDFCNKHNDITIYISPLQLPPYSIFKYVHDRYMKSKNIFLLVASTIPEKTVKPNKWFINKYKVKDFNINDVENMLKRSDAYLQIRNEQEKYLQNIWKESWEGTNYENINKVLNEVKKKYKDDVFSMWVNKECVALMFTSEKLEKDKKFKDYVYDAVSKYLTMEERTKFILFRKGIKIIG